MDKRLLHFKIMVLIQLQLRMIWKSILVSIFLVSNWSLTWTKPIRSVRRMVSR